jgi:hypothetical protein
MHFELVEKRIRIHGMVFPLGEYEFHLASDTFGNVTADGQ